ncbi:protein of unknown function [Chitinophaga terrae (ex Kim and Jung 2007)]|uniref:DUF3560 domain-containing protein n=1 Tax=Chitinophaga terrae (ex Kim and Jung 2007) TaxID=408074 RepID=A0A1H4BN12_9BACT|nr:DUF3560 domain-containing protein [Chitinophaga terrae (ex Kim and Jung 2007)]MDQ0110265.1 hypothetical protein [Chitinophaga terrae (ex Kim and Jung 2007)]GEP89673.1 hypothetical protein CTE07_13180 [Chitinophaga terrae (ex Kim and Jung 2007)]SEA49565.1 protein of unknown function [Chitinophaga terrae (ex Kim and Jung 2007)]
MKYNYHQRRQNRIAFAKAQAEKNERASDSFYNAAKHISIFIPPGQPILVGHHSEKRHRREQKKIDNNMRKSYEASDKAIYYEDKAKNIEKNHTISSDNPDALELLHQKLNDLTALQEFMKSANKAIRKNDKAAFLKIPKATDAMWEKLNTPDWIGRKGFPDYKLTNNNSVINNTRKRIASLEILTQKTTTERTEKGVRIVENVEANRIQLVFPAKPNKEVRTKLRRQYGFNFCYEEMAWQRQLNNAGIYAADAFIESYNPE